MAFEVGQSYERLRDGKRAIVAHLDPQQHYFGLMLASKNGSHRQTCLKNGAATKDARAAVARDGLPLRSPTTTP
jgi:hypothetical protein